MDGNQFGNANNAPEEKGLEGKGLYDIHGNPFGYYEAIKEKMEGLADQIVNLEIDQSERHKYLSLFLEFADSVNNLLYIQLGKGLNDGEIEAIRSVLIEVEKFWITDQVQNLIEGRDDDVSKVIRNRSIIPLKLAELDDETRERAENLVNYIKFAYVKMPQVVADTQNKINALIKKVDSELKTLGSEAQRFNPNEDIIEKILNNINPKQDLINDLIFEIFKDREISSKLLLGDYFWYSVEQSIINGRLKLDSNDESYLASLNNKFNLLPQFSEYLISLREAVFELESILDLNRGSYFYITRDLNNLDVVKYLKELKETTVSEIDRIKQFALELQLDSDNYLDYLGILRSTEYRQSRNSVFYRSLNLSEPEYFGKGVNLKFSEDEFHQHIPNAIEFIGSTYGLIGKAQYNSADGSYTYRLENEDGVIEDVIAEFHPIQQGSRKQTHTILMTEPNGKRRIIAYVNNFYMIGEDGVRIVPDLMYMHMGHEVGHIMKIFSEMKSKGFRRYSHYHSNEEAEAAAGTSQGAVFLNEDLKKYIPPTEGISVDDIIKNLVSTHSLPDINRILSYMRNLSLSLDLFGSDLGSYDSLKAALNSLKLSYYDFEYLDREKNEILEYPFGWHNIIEPNYCFSLYGLRGPVQMYDYLKSFLAGPEGLERLIKDGVINARHLEK